MMSNESLSASGKRRVPRPIICLNIAIDPTGRNSTMLLARSGGRHRWRASADVVAITGVSDSVSAKLPRWPRPISCLVADDPHHVVGVLLGEVGVRVVQRAAHLVGVLLVDAEDDRLGQAIGRLQVVGEVVARRPRSARAARRPARTARSCRARRDLLAEQVELTGCRRPAVRVGAEHDATHPVGGEEAVLDALRERVLEHGVAEVVVGVGRLVALRRRRHPELRRRGEVIEDAPPRGVAAALPRWHSSTMTRSKKSGANCAEDPVSSSPLSASAW